MGRYRLTDVYVSYAADDSAWTAALAKRLMAHELNVFFDRWRILPGDIVVHERERAISAAANGIVVVSPAAERSPAAREEYAALYRTATERGRRFIPVLIGGATAPPFAGNRIWRDFSRVTPDEYDTKVAELAAAIAGRPTNGSGPAREDFAATLPGGERPVTPPDRPAIVVCHVAADHEYGRQLTALLDRHQLPAWSLGSLRPGDEHFWTIRQQLRYAVAVVVLMSPESQNSPDIENMILEAKQHRRPFIPILLHGKRNYHLTNTWFLDARDGTLPGATEIALLRDLHRAHRGGKPIDLAAVLPVPSPRPAVGAVEVPTNVSLNNLDRYLRQGEVRHADLLTTTLLLTAADRLDHGWLRRVDGERLPFDLLAAVADLWGRHTHDRQGFAAQLAIAALDGERHAHFMKLSTAYGWRDTIRHDVERDYREFADRVGPGGRAGFFPTLRNPQREHYSDWYGPWTATAIAVHLRLREWGKRP